MSGDKFEPSTLIRELAEARAEVERLREALRVAQVAHSVLSRNCSVDRDGVMICDVRWVDAIADALAPQTEAKEGGEEGGNQ